ncbi:DUF1835 domain-containing protein [Gottschalkiaceae bacterium SANA]|nr:DUF1835 domain-containing protein [Gottschalkiaceae bacterium SANA]
MKVWKHLVVGDSVEGSLRAAFAMDTENLFSGEVRNFRDDLSVGRIDRLSAGSEERIDWFSKITSGTEFGSYLEERLESLMDETYQEMLEFDLDDQIVIWHSGIVSEQTAIRYFAMRLQGHDLWEVDMSKQKVHRWNGSKVIPRAVAECAPKELLEALMGKKVISKEKQETLKMDWIRLQSSDAVLRVFENGEINSVDETYYDRELLEALEDHYQRAARVIGAVMGSSDQIIGDTFLDYRLRTLIQGERLQWRGNLSAMRYYEVRKRA